MAEKKYIQSGTIPSVKHLLKRLKKSGAPGSMDLDEMLYPEDTEAVVSAGDLTTRPNLVGNDHMEVSPRSGKPAEKKPSLKIREG